MRDYKSVASESEVGVRKKKKQVENQKERIVGRQATSKSERP